MMKTKVLTHFILLSFMVFLFSCGKNASALKDNKPAVMVKSQHLNDNSSFTMSNGERCTIVADATIDYPVSAGEDMSVDSLQRLFAVAAFRAFAGAGGRAVEPIVRERGIVDERREERRRESRLEEVEEICHNTNLYRCE